MKILIACGGTAGHIFPGLALAEELRREDRGNQVVLVISTHPQDRKYLKVSSEFLKELHIETIEAGALPYQFSPKLIIFSLKFLLAFLRAFIIILRYSPEVVIGFGGYVSFAPLIAARLFAIPTLIHEQNLIPGRANRLLARVVNKVAISFDDTAKFFPGQKFARRIVKTGMPLRKHILDCQINRSAQSTADKKFTILIAGGSQGAHKINELVLNCLSQMDEDKRAQMHLMHLAGKTDVQRIQAEYKNLGMSAEVYDFLDDMASVYSIADLLIARSGASTIFEAASFGLPCILIPHAYGTKHQKENALYLKHRGAALVLEEETTSGKDLEKMMLEIISNKTLRENLAQQIKMLVNSQAANCLKEEIKALLAR